MNLKFFSLVRNDLKYSNICGWSRWPRISSVCCSQIPFLPYSWRLTEYVLSPDFEVTRQIPLGGTDYHFPSTWVLPGIYCFFVFSLAFCWPLFAFLSFIHLIIVLSFFLRLMASDYPCVIFNLFSQNQLLRLFYKDLFELFRQRDNFCFFNFF